MLHFCYTLFFKPVLHLGKELGNAHLGVSLSEKLRGWGDGDRKRRKRFSACRLRSMNSVGEVKTMLDSLHLHLKTDQRPDGSRIAAVEKIEYINRNGKYADIDEERLRQHDVFQHAIFASSAIERHLDSDQLLYDSPFGRIKQTTDGKIMVSNDASVETVAIALTVANRIYGEGKLILSGDRRFYGKSMVAGCEIDLPLHFEDSVIEAKYQRKREEYQRERAKCNSCFGAGNRKLHQERGEGTHFPIPHAKPSTGKILTTGERLRVSVLPKRNLEIHKANGASVLLHSTKGVLLDDGRTEQRGAMRRNIHRNGQKQDYAVRTPKSDRPRWNLGAERRRYAEETAKRILIRLQDSLDRTFAYSHIQYINREAAFQKRGGCIGRGHSLPQWANDDPKRFFEAADLYERANGERYKEIEFALPNELPFDAQREIVENFICRILPNHYYAYAMHDKIGQMSDGAHNVHVHIMFTTRENDAYEKTVGRDAKTFFSRANAKNPEKGGCPKAKRWNDKDRRSMLRDEIRPAATEITNDVLKRYGFDSRISEKSLATRKEQAEKDGDTVLAKILDRMPEQHLDLKIVLRGDEEVDELKLFRQIKKAAAKDEYTAELMKAFWEEAKIQKALNPAKAQLDWLLKRKNADEKNLLMLRQALIKNSKAMLWAKNSYLVAAKKFMSENERKQFEGFIMLCQTKAGLEKMLSVADSESKHAVSIRLDEIRRLIQREAPKCRKTFTKLESKKLDVLREQRAMLQNNKSTKSKLLAALKKIDQFWKQEEANRKKQLETKARTYKMGDIRELLMVQYDQAKAAYAVQKTLTIELKKKVISYERAVMMAEGKFTGGDYKALRQNQRKLEKSEKYLWHDKNQYEAALAIWQKLGEGNPYKKADIDAQKKRIDERLLANYKLRRENGKEAARLETLCSTPAAKASIQKMALGIMAKNRPTVEEYEKAVQRLNVLQNRITVTAERLEATRKRLITFGDKAIYKTTIHQSGSVAPNIQAHRDAQTIADGILGKEAAIPKVMQNMSGEDDDWSMLTESAKAERMADNRFREDW